MRITYYVRADYHDHREGSGRLNLKCRTFKEAQTARDDLNWFRDVLEVNPSTLVRQGTETERQFKLRVRAIENRNDRLESLANEWFPSGSGYLTSVVKIVRRRWSEEVVS